MAKFKTARFFTASVMASLALHASPQYNQQFEVEGMYVPDYIAHDRIGVFPKPLKLSVDNSSLAYSLTGVNANFLPQPQPIPATGWNDSRSWSQWKGYLDLGLGSWLTSTLSAGYRFVDNSHTVAGIRLQHNSSSLFHPRISPSTSDNRAQHYDESIGIFASHTFDGAGRIEGAIDYHLGYFNYYGYNPQPFASDATSIEAPTQTVNDLALRIDWLSPSELENIDYNFGAALRYFGYRRLYLPSDDAYSPLSLTGGRETDASLHGGFDVSLAEKSAIGLDLDAHILAYSGFEGRGVLDGAPSTLAAPSTYGTLTLLPYYRFSKNRLGVLVGATLDLAFNAGNPVERYRTFSAAPNIKLDYDAGPVALFLHLLGDLERHTLAGHHQECYYSVPAILNSSPSYTPLDARLGFNFGPFSGFSAGFELAYRITKDHDFFGWYQTIVSGPRAFEALGLPSQIDGKDVYYSDELDAGCDIHGFSAGLRLGYDAGRYFKIDLEGTYQPQNGKKGYCNGMDRARWTTKGAIESNPWSTLKLKLGADFRGVRAFPIYAYVTGASDNYEPFIHMYRIDDWFSLNLGASYDFTDRFGIWIQGDNLTNHRNTLLPGLPVPGITLTGGISLLF